jgi:D-alanyl-D-alanine carboxypeptidase/D-alanyl-D-alanine-endopeptidase (penicillin-binding protein 4)
VGGVINESSKPDTTKLNIFNPTFYFLQIAKEAFLKKGIAITGIIDTTSLPNETVKIATYEREIKPVILNTNKNSDNLSAEMLLRALSNKYYGKHASAERGLQFVDSLITLAGFNPKNYFLADGSGLSHYNLVSAGLIIGVLKYVYNSQPKIFQELFESFPVSGYDGSLINRMKKTSSFKKVHGKTGTLKGASALSGYIESRNNHMLAFSVMIQNYTGSAKQARDIQDQICELIYQLY